ncbi:beta strand repeat-containing protein [Gloeothece verrucosa]|uniref:Cadherin n=1 Tax=Gloeothece verrucosa (strain PCC 7822) TaxID=497965 RepID=E0UMG6_GLOV7|nr:cadherin domain-containing protein [Gloeothece verrucosa]ADN18146.1 Cadherin [Gloeothece verrucosa PCC 7822]
MATITGTTGNDNLAGTDSGDNINGGSGNDTISGNAGGDEIYGEDGDDVLNGGNDGDALLGGIGNDILNGDAGNDNLFSDAGNDTINGGSGTDNYNADYSNASSGLIMTYDSATGNGTIVVGSEIDTFTSIELFNYFQGTNFNDVIFGGSANDFRINGGSGNDTISGNAGGDEIYGDDGDDVLNGGNDGDALRGGIGNDILNGDAGNDGLFSDAGNDTINGGSGTDNYNADYSNASSGLIMTYDSATGNGTIVVGSETDTFTSIELFNYFQGTNFNDVIFGGSANDFRINGGSGNDTISGNAGGDEIYGDDGDDVLNGGNDGDALRGGIGNDILNGDAGNDGLFSDAGNDTINGGSGTDNYNADYSNASSGLIMTYDSATGNGTIVVGSETDTFTSIELFNYFQGTNFNDVIFGGSANDFRINGGSGNDTISGNAGGDEIYGEDGNDVLNGGNDGDALFGGIGNDILNGDAGNDYLSGGNGNDTLQGTNNGVGERDPLEGGTESDRFILGDTTKIFYDDGNSTLAGSNDYAQINDFNPTEDIIQLNGSSNNYLLTVSGSNTNLYINKPGTEPDELIAIIQNQTGLSLTNPYFSYVSSNSAPVLNDTTLTVPENSPLNTLVGTITATDADNNPLTYSITAGNPNLDGDATPAFTINNNGQIRVADPDDIDFERNPNNPLTVTVSDGSLTDTATITVNLTDVIETPNRPPVANDATFTLVKTSPINTAVGTVTATDPDNNPLTYSITAGNLDSDGDNIKAFSISNAGVITITDPDDISSQTNPFNLTVTVSDGNLTDTAAITVNLTSPVNRAPVVNDGVFSISKNTANGTVVGTINATDPDNNPLTYSIIAGNPDTDGDNIKAFAISNTGVITVTDKDDILAQTNPFNLTVQGSDGNLTDTGIATINLNNVNPLSFQLKLYEDNNGAVGSEITGNTAIKGNKFFAEILVGDTRTNAAGLVINALNFNFAPDVAQNLNNFSDISNVNNPLVTSNFPLFRGGTLDNTNGTITNLSGGSLPQGNQGSAIGINQLSRFGLLQFDVVGTRDNSNLTLTFDASQIGFADGTFADPNDTLTLTRNIIINDAPIVNQINNVNLAERSAAGTVVVADNLVEATDDNLTGQAVTFSLSTSPKDASGNGLFAINATTGEITLTQAGFNTIDYESGVTSYQLGVKATDGFKLSTERLFSVNITNVNEAGISVDKTAITFGTRLSQYRQGATDSLFVRPNFADKTQFIEITNTAVGTNDILAISSITINAQNVTTNANFSNGDLLLNPGETRRIALNYAPKAAREDFNLLNGLVINSNAQNSPAFNIQLAGKSTFNSDISYDGKVNLTDLNTLQRPGLFGSSSGQNNYDPTADITGDGRINLAELVSLNAEFGLVV